MCKPGLNLGLSSITMDRKQHIVQQSHWQNATQRTGWKQQYGAHTADRAQGNKTAGTPLLRVDLILGSPHSSHTPPSVEMAGAPQGCR